MVNFLRRPRRMGAAAALAVALLCTSCIGSNRLFEGLRDWNREVSDSKYVNELIFLPLVIFPVYSFALLGDYIIFNTIEFWTDDNPLPQPKSRRGMIETEEGGA